VNQVRTAIADSSTKYGQAIHDTLTGSLAGASLSDLKIKLAGIDEGLAKFRENPALALVAGNSINDLLQMRAETLAAIARLADMRPGSPDERQSALDAALTAIANKSGSPDERDALNQIAQNTALTAAHTALIAGIRVPGKVPVMGHIGAIGSESDPFGFSHLKIFALGQLDKNDPIGLKRELQWHLAGLQKTIDAANARGDTKAVAKLQETKAGLEFMLGQVNAGIFTTGNTEYEAVLNAIAAINGTTTAVVNLPMRIAYALRGAQGGHGGPAGHGGTSGTSGGTTTTTSGGTVTVPHQTGGVPYASGDVGLARMPYQAMFGEAGTEGVAVIRNPREWAGAGVRVDIHPQPVRFSLNGRDIINGLLLSEAFTRRSAT
jgi:hypothetical protein